MCVAALQTNGYEELWTIQDHLEQQQQQSSLAAECSMETATPPSYTHTAPPPPYTEHPRLGEVSLHQSYHYEPQFRQHEVISDDNNLMSVENNGQSRIGWLDDNTQDHNVNDNATMYDDDDDASLMEQQHIANETDEQITDTSFHEDQSTTVHRPQATSTPTQFLNELQVSANSNIFVKSLTPSPTNNLPPINKPIPSLRPIRMQNLSAPNLFESYPPPVRHDVDPMLNNTIPRMGYLPPLRRKLNFSNNRSLSDGRLPSPFYSDHYRTLSRSESAGECPPITEVSCEPTSNETIPDT